MRAFGFSIVALGALAAAACGPKEPPPAPEPIVRVDTVVVTREVAPPLPTGTPGTVCLASGQSVDIAVTAAGDTLVGAKRVSLRDLGPGVGFAGNYAMNKDWFVNDQSIVMNRRSYKKFGSPVSKSCSEIAVVGQHNGVNVFADTGASTPYQTIYVPVQPGMFQPYQSSVGRVRG